MKVGYMIKLEKANIEDRGGELHRHRRAAGFQGHRRADAGKGQLRYRPQRAVRAERHGLSGAAPHQRRTDTLPAGLPAVRQRVDGTQAHLRRGGRPDQRHAAAGAEGHRSGDRQDRPDGVQLCGLPHLRRGGSHRRRHRKAVRVDRRGQCVGDRSGDAVGQPGEKPPDAAESPAGGGDAAPNQPPAEHPLYRHRFGGDERPSDEPVGSGQRAMVFAAESGGGVRRRAFEGVPAARGVHQRRQPAAEIPGVPGH